MSKTTKKWINKVSIVLLVPIIVMLANNGFVIASILEKVLVGIGFIVIIYLLLTFSKILYIVFFKDSSDFKS